MGCNPVKNQLHSHYLFDMIYKTDNSILRTELIKMNRKFVIGLFQSQKCGVKESTSSLSYIDDVVPITQCFSYRENTAPFQFFFFTKHCEQLLFYNAL